MVTMDRNFPLRTACQRNDHRASTSSR